MLGLERRDSSTYSIDKTIISSCRDSQLKMSPLTSLVLLAVQAVGALGQAPVPVVLWHGMGDSAAGMIGIAVSDRKPQLSRECHYSFSKQAAQ